MIKDTTDHKILKNHCMFLSLLEFVYATLTIEFDGFFVSEFREHYNCIRDFNRKQHIKNIENPFFESTFYNNVLQKSYVNIISIYPGMEQICKAQCKLRNTHAFLAGIGWFVY